MRNFTGFWQASLLGSLALVLLVGCSSLSTNMPEETNLTGIWKLEGDEDVSKWEEESGRRGRGSAQRQGLRLHVEELDIHQRDNATRIEYDQRELIVYHWGREHKNMRRLESGWRGDVFVVKEQVGKRETLERSFQLADDKRHLIVSTDFDGKVLKNSYSLDLETTQSVYPDWKGS